MLKAKWKPIRIDHHASGMPLVRGAWTPEMLVAVQKSLWIYYDTWMRDQVHHIELNRWTFRASKFYLHRTRTCASTIAPQALGAVANCWLRGDMTLSESSMLTFIGLRSMNPSRLRHLLHNCAPGTGLQLKGESKKAKAWGAKAAGQSVNASRSAEFLES